MVALQPYHLITLLALLAAVGGGIWLVVKAVEVVVTRSAVHASRHPADRGCMARTPDDRQVYTCPTCGGARVVEMKRAGGTETVDCSTCDGSGQIVGGPG